MNKPKTNKMNVGARPVFARESGITLVALVITIIVLIILAGVSINAVMNGGIIENAKGARSDFDASKENETTVLSDLEQEIENVKGSWVQDGYTITNKKDPSKTYTVGQKVKYTPQTEVTTYTVKAADSGTDSDQTINQVTGINWHILGVNENGRLELISDKDTGAIKVYNQIGYDNIDIILLNVARSLYLDSTTGSSVKCATRDDFHVMLSYNSRVWDEDSGVSGRMWSPNSDGDLRLTSYDWPGGADGRVNWSLTNETGDGPTMYPNTCDPFSGTGDYIYTIPVVTLGSDFEVELVTE